MAKDGSQLTLYPTPEIAAEVDRIVAERMEQLNGMSRKELRHEYQRITGFESHPRISSHWLRVALARICQEREWCGRVLNVPRQVLMGSLAFWMTNSVIFLPKERVAHEERSKRNALKAARKGSAVAILAHNRCHNFVLKWVDGSKNPWSANVQSEVLRHRFFRHLQRQKVLSYGEVEKWCKGQPFDPMPQEMYVAVVEAQAAQLAVIDRQGQLTVVDVHNMPVEPVDDTQEALTGPCWHNGDPPPAAEAKKPTKLPNVIRDDWQAPPTGA